MFFRVFFTAILKLAFVKKAILCLDQILINNSGVHIMAENNANQPIVKLNAQYLKDFSFESPSSPASLVPQKEAPKIEVSLNLEAKESTKDNFEVIIHITCSAKTDAMNIFTIEAKYAGLFTIQNLEPAQKEQVLLIHCPTILFPFARRIIADGTRDGGFQPLMIDPIDFAYLYQQRKTGEEAEKNGNGQVKAN